MKRILALVTGATVAGCTAWLLACGPFTVELHPVLTRMPADPPGYAKGELGVVRPEFTLGYLLQAYRTLTPRAPDRNTTPASADVSTKGDTDQADPARRWALISGALLGTTKAGDPAPEVEQSRHVPGDQYQTFLNCPDDAFAGALRTLEARKQRFGGGAQLLDWARAQAAVFENCHDGPLVLPPALPGNADALTRADRAYQTAAAYFYAMQYEEAVTRFRAIAGDSGSAWRPFGRYLAGRASIRFATVPTAKLDRDRLAVAETDLRAALADSTAAPIHRSARGLLGYLSARIHPVDRLHELSKRLTAPAGPDEQDYLDYRFILTALADAGPTAPSRADIVRGDDLTDWLLTMRGGGGDVGAAHAIDRWRADRSPHWLVAALWQVRAPAPSADALLEAAQRLPRESPAFATVAFLRVRLLAAVGRRADARSVLASLAARPAPGFGAETINLLDAERLMLAENLDQFLATAPRTIVVEWGEPPRIPNGRISVKPPSHDEPVFDEDAATVLSEQFPLTRLVDAALSPRLPPRLRLRVALAAFTRAIVLKRDEAGARLVPALRELAPALAADLDRYARAGSGSARYDAGVLLLLNTPGATVDVRGVEDDYWLGITDPEPDFDHTFRRNWWCESRGAFHASISMSGPPEAVHVLYPGDRVTAPAFLTAAERDAAAREVRAILAEGPPRDFLGRAALRMAAQRPNDPAVAEALARVVDGWRWTCGTDDNSATPLPQQAFAALHRIFPKSDAARRTKYWYRD